MTTTTQAPTPIAVSIPAVPESVPQIRGAGPLWRSLLVPRPEQRALEFAGVGSSLFASLRAAGVRIERATGQGDPDGAPVFDLVLDDRTNGGPRRRPGRIRPLLVPGGRWVVVLEKKRWVGFAGRRVFRRARREGFESIETFYAYPSLRAPRILVPLDHPEPFRYFLDLVVGARSRRQRLIVLAARCLCAIRLHRFVLPNLILVARRRR